MARLKPLLMMLGALLALALGVCLLAGAWALAFAEQALYFPDTPRPDLRAVADPEVIERGRYLAHGPAHCAQCHSTADRDHPERSLTESLHGGLVFDMGPLAARYARNLTSDPETGIGALSDADIARTLRTGVTHTDELSFFMRYSAARLADEDIVAVLSYLRTLPPEHNPVPPGEWRPLGKVLLMWAFPPLAPRRDDPGPWVSAGEEPTVERGRYLAESVMVCGLCHTAMDPATFEPAGPPMGGSLPDPSHGADSDMEFVAPNLTSHPTGITGKLSEDAFVARLRAGRVYASSIMPWESFGLTTEADLRSVYRYLRSLPPVDADMGPTYRKQGWTRE